MRNCVGNLPQDSTASNPSYLAESLSAPGSPAASTGSLIWNNPLKNVDLTPAAPPLGAHGPVTKQYTTPSFWNNINQEVQLQKNSSSIATQIQGHVAGAVLGVAQAALPSSGPSTTTVFEDGFTFKTIPEEPATGDLAEAGLSWTGIGKVKSIGGAVKGFGENVVQNLSGLPIPFFGSKKPASGAPSSVGARSSIPSRVQILEQEGNTVSGSFKVAGGEARFMADVTRQGDTLIISGAHIEGDATLKEVLQTAERYGREQGVARVIVQGGTRSTGANPGHIPRPLVIEVK
jgi:hypothetical protein